MYKSVDKKGYVYECIGYREKTVVNGKTVSKVRKTNKVIGKMVDGEFVPNEYYLRREAEQKLSELNESVKAEEKKVCKEEKTVSSRKKAGLSLAVEGVMEKQGIYESLVSTFGEDESKKIVSVCEYFITTRCAAMDDFCYFDKEYEHMHGAIISSAGSSRLFADITEEDVNSFFRTLQSKAPRICGRDNEGSYAFFDSTAFSSYSDDIDIVASSKGKQDPDLDHFNLAAIHSSKSGMCSYYRLYRGNIPDIKTVEDLVEVAKAMDYNMDRILFDRGYGSWENIFLIHKRLKSHIMVMLKSRFSSYTKAIEAAGEDFKHSSACYIPEQEVFGITVTESVTLNIGEGDEKEETTFHVHIHVFYSPKRYGEEREKLEVKVLDEISRLEKELEEKKLKAEDVKSGSWSSSAKKFINVRKHPQGKVSFEKNPEAIDAALSKAGCFCILSTEAMTAEEAIMIYRKRDSVERLFNCVKNDLGFTRAEVKSDDTLQGKAFCVMISGMVATVFKNCINENRAEFTRKMTYNKFTKELEGIYTHMVKGKKVWCEISARQKLILDKLGIENPSDSKPVSKKREYKKKVPSKA